MTKMPAVSYHTLKWNCNVNQPDINKHRIS